MLRKVEGNTVLCASKIEGAQHMICMKKIRFSRHPRSNVGRQGPLGLPNIILCRGCAFLIQLVFCKKKTMWFIGVEVEQETSAPPAKKNPGSAPVVQSFICCFHFSP